MSPILKHNFPVPAAIKFTLLVLLLSLFSHKAQAQTNCPAYTSGVLASSRIADWCQNAGLPATFLDGETTANAWTPPMRTKCGSTVAAGTSFATINSDLAACPAGTYLLLGPGSFSSSSTGLSVGNQNNVTLRGSGADQTFIYCSGSCTINLSSSNSGEPSGPAWTAGYSQGSTSLTFASGVGTIGQNLILYGNNSLSSDPGGVWVCSTSPQCSLSGGNNDQSQVVLITGCDGVTTLGHSCSSGSNITISPGVYMPNWGSNINSGLNGTPVNNTSVGVGLEDATLDFTGSTINNAAQIGLTSCYACWVKGNRIINAQNNSGPQQITTKYSHRWLVANNYFYGATTNLTNAASSVTQDTDSDGMIINNITDLGTIYWQGASAGTVVAYNYQRDAVSNTGNNTYAPVIVTHESGESFILLEGNQNGDVQFDLDHSTQNLDTVFRNLFNSNDPPYTSSSNAQAVGVQGVARFVNIVGNVLGDPNVTTSYQITPSAGSGLPIYYLGVGPDGGPTDTLARTSSLRWGNFDVVNNAARWCGTGSESGCGGTPEVPTSLSGNALPFNNPVPSNHNLPPSFFMSTAAHPNGGTGLSWWKVCTNYPTCSTSQTPPYPPIGPDVTGGSAIVGNTTDLYSGHANNIPAATAWENLPIDTSYQASYSISGSSGLGGRRH